jgi:hypothetical protein
MDLEPKAPSAARERSLTMSLGMPDEGTEAHDRTPEWSPWLRAKGPLRPVVETVIKQALNAEAHIRAFTRKRTRRAADLAIFRETIEALVCHTLYEALHGADNVRLSLANDVLRRSNRYISRLNSTQLPTIVRLLSSPDLAFLKLTEGVAPTPFSPGRQTRVRVGQRLSNLVAKVDVDFDHIERMAGEELVLLKGTKDTDTGRAELVDYEDTNLTHQYRGEVQTLNRSCSAADVAYVGQTELVDPRNRHMKRRFTRGAFGNGGRLWGGFWQHLQKADRLANVRINGERVVSIDFVEMIGTIAYAYVGKPTPQDIYTIAFTNTEGKPVTLPRRVVKKVFAARLNGAKEWPAELREYRRGLPWKSVVASLKHAYPDIADVFDKDLGQVFAFTESEVLVDVLLKLADRGVVALPVHDCIVVAESDVDIAQRAMLETFTYHTHQPGRVAIERAA